MNIQSYYGDRGCSSVWDIAKDIPALRALFSNVVKASTAPPVATHNRSSTKSAERNFSTSSKLKGYSYLSIYFGTQQFQSDW
jgi:hypothetical protein